VGFEAVSRTSFLEGVAGSAAAASAAAAAEATTAAATTASTATVHALLLGALAPFAALGLVGKALLGEELLLANGENELAVAINARQSLVGELARRGGKGVCCAVLLDGLLLLLLGGLALLCAHVLILWRGEKRSGGDGGSG